MNAYRPEPNVPGLPFPRKNLGAFTAVVVIAALFVPTLPVALLLGVAGVHAFQVGGLGCYATFATSLLVAVACGVAGARAVRGDVSSKIVLLFAPLLPLWVSTAFAFRSLRQVEDAVSAEAVDGSFRLRLLATAFGEIDITPGYGCLVAAVASGVSALALLGSGASVDHRRMGAPASGALGAPLALGLVALIVATILPFVVKTGFASLVVVLPSFLLLTGLASVAGTNGVVVRHWREPRETDRWVQTMLAASLIPAVAFGLLTFGLSVLLEARSLQAFSSMAGVPSERGAVLAALAEERSRFVVLGIVDASLAVVVVLPAAFSGLGRGGDGRLRFPRAALFPATLLVASLGLPVAWTTRDRVISSLGRVADLGDGVDTGVDLPRVPFAPVLVAAGPASFTVTVPASGPAKVTRAPRWQADVAPGTVVIADRHARWEHVARGISEALREPRAASVPLELRLAPIAKVDRTALGAYAPFLGSEVVALRIEAAYEGDEDLSRQEVVRGLDHEMTDAVVAKLVALASRPGAWGRRVVLAVPPQ
jgi:hypothetical protein